MNRKLFVFSLLLTGVTVILVLSSRRHAANVQSGSTEPISGNAAEVEAEFTKPPEVELPAKSVHALANPRVAIGVKSAPIETWEPWNSHDPDANRDWARKHPAEAFAWLVNAPEGPQRDTIAEIVCLQLAESNPAQAVTTAERYCPACTNLLESLAQQWAEKDAQAAYNWAASQPAGEARDQMLSRVAFVQSKSTPETAATLVAEQIPPGEIQTEAAISVVYQWALRDAKAAMAWAESFPPGNLRERAISEVEKVTATASRNGNSM